jgi:hypothetical protein
MATNREKDLKEFVRKIDDMKKVNPKDLSSDQDLSIAIMNLISIEEHLVFTGAKTSKTLYYDLISEVRDMRKSLLQQIIKKYEGEVWCISKHLLAASMRLMEVGTKQQDLGNPEEAYRLFDNAYELYCLFWGLNMNAINIGDVAWAKDISISVDEIAKHAANTGSKTEKSEKLSTGNYSEKGENVSRETKIEHADAGLSRDNSRGEDLPKKGFMASLKETIKKAVNCCIE